MKRDLDLQLKILKKIEKHKFSAFEYEEFTTDMGGYEYPTTPNWDDDEVYNIELLLAEGKLKKNKVTDSPHLENYEGGVCAESYISMTSIGHEWLENRGIWRYVRRNLTENIPTIVTSVVVAVFSAWILSFAGLSK